MRISQKFDLQMRRLVGVSGAGEVKIDGVCAKRQHRNAGCPTEKGTYKGNEAARFEIGRLLRE